MVEENPVPPPGTRYPSTREELEAALLGGGAEKGTQEFQAGLVLLAGLLLGNRKLARISRFTEVPLAQVDQYAARLRAAGIWTPEGYTACHWGEPDGKGEVSFWLDVFIALGRVKKVAEDQYRFIGVRDTEGA